MRVVILHDRLGDDASVDAADALAQAEVFGAALRAGGHGVSREAVDLDLRRVADLIAPCDLVVNLVETLEGRGSLIHVAPTLVEALGKPMTGCPAQAIAATSDKVTAKRMFRACGIPTPEWIGEGDDGAGLGGRWIVKSVWEHASIGLGPGSIVDAAERDVAAAVREAGARLGGRAFAERYIDGREFNLSLLEVDGRPVVLPAAEIVFEGYGDERPRIVDYAAKWSPGSYEYTHTPRTFEIQPEDRALVAGLEELAGRCWEAFGLRGYARVDFRVDAGGRPWVLEVNSNPCLSPDAGYLASAERAGLSAGAVVDRLVGAALEGKGACSAFDR